MTTRRSARSRAAAVVVAVSIAAFGLTACNPLGPGIGTRLPSSTTGTEPPRIPCVKIPGQLAENCEYQKLWDAALVELQSGDQQRIRSAILAVAGPAAIDLRVLNWIQSSPPLDAACVTRNLHGFLSGMSRAAPVRVVADRLLSTALEFVKLQLPPTVYTLYMIAVAPKVLSAAMTFGQQARVLILSLTLRTCRTTTS